MGENTCVYKTNTKIYKKCIGPGSLASLCKLLFEEFSQRNSGMPDLWYAKS
jgi:hypothetical protein